MKRKIVLDTNVLISALVFGGKPRVIYEMIVLSNIFVAHSSENALVELLRVLKLKFKYSIDNLQMVENNFRENLQIVEIGKIPERITVDPSDNEFLAIADSAKAELIISGDSHLLALKKYKKVKTITPTKFLEEV